MSLPAARDEYTVRDSMGSYRTRLHLNVFARATGEQSLFIAAGEHCRVFVITGNAVLITQSFLFFFNINNPTSAILSVRHCSRCSLPADAKLSAWMRAVKQRPLCIQHFSFNLHGRHIVCRVRFSLAYIFRDAYNLFGRVFRPR